MRKTTPHVIPYQGSKRKLADRILSYTFPDIDTLIEPFAGSAAITLAAASRNLAKRYVIADKLEPLMEIWKMIVNEPDRLINEYTNLWTSQISDPARYYTQMRSEYNKSKSPAILLYLIARCVKNSIRFNNMGEFNQSPDHRRLGLNPKKLSSEILKASELLKDRVLILAGDFKDILKSATPGDLIYMDPPWQGTSNKRDHRYAYLLDFGVLIEALNSLNTRKIPYILSFDGACGNQTYGQKMPDYLDLKKVSLDAGRSTQATLLGRDDRTIESLYISPVLRSKIGF